MSDINSIYARINELIDAVDDEEDLEEVTFEFEPFKKNMEHLLEAQDLDAFMNSYQKMCDENSAVIHCFEQQSADELTAYLQEQEKTLDDLKMETVNVSCDILELIIFDVEADY